MESDEESSFVETTLEEFHLIKYLDAFLDFGVTKDNFFSLNEPEIKLLINDNDDRLKFVLKREALFKKNGSMVVFNLQSDQQDVDSESYKKSNSEDSIENNKLNAEQVPEVMDTSEPSQEDSLGNDNQNADPVLMDTSESSKEETHEPLESERPTTSGTHATKQGEALRQLLSQTFGGRLLLQKTQLVEDDRKSLCEEIVRPLLNKNLKIPRNHFIFWANEIISVFPKEVFSVYHKLPDKTNKKKNQGGKLYDKYTNLKKKYNKNKPKSSQPKETSQVTAANPLEKIRKANFVNANTKQLWISTYSTRDRKDTICEYYEEYPVLKSSLGITLLEIDFGLSKLTDDADIFFKQWPILVPKILNLAKLEKLCSNLLHLQGVDDQILALAVLPYLFKPFVVQPKKKGGPDAWRASKAEIAQGFIYNVSSISNLQPHWDHRQEKLRKCGLKQQPIILAVGEIQSLSAVYVVINEIKYECRDLLHAVDRCFKSLYALQAAYAHDALPVWQFIQKVYNIQPEKEQMLTDVIVVWNKLAE